jgi:hypothetical protein
MRLVEIECQRERAQQRGGEMLHQVVVVEQRLPPAWQVLRPSVRCMHAAAGKDIGIVRRIFVLVLEAFVEIRRVGIFAVDT